MHDIQVSSYPSIQKNQYPRYPSIRISEKSGIHSSLVLRNRAAKNISLRFPRNVFIHDITSVNYFLLNYIRSAYSIKVCSAKSSDIRQFLHIKVVDSGQKKRMKVIIGKIKTLSKISKNVIDSINYISKYF